MFKRYFGYSGPIYIMYKTLNKATATEEEKTQVNKKENRLTGLIEMIKGKHISDTKLFFT